MTGISGPVNFRRSSSITGKGFGYTPPSTQCISASRKPSWGSVKYVIVPIVSPDGMKINSTELSNPPPDTDSRPDPSGRHRQMRAPLPFNSVPSFVLILNPRLASHMYIQPSGPKNGPLNVAAL